MITKVLVGSMIEFWMTTFWFMKGVWLWSFMFHRNQKVAIQNLTIEPTGDKYFSDVLLWRMEYTYLWWPQNNILMLCFLYCIIGLCSQEEERLVRDLFRGYNKLIRPVQNMTQKVEVAFGLAFIQLINVVSLQKQQQRYI